MHFADQNDLLNTTVLQFIIYRQINIFIFLITCPSYLAFLASLPLPHPPRTIFLCFCRRRWPSSLVPSYSRSSWRGAAGGERHHIAGFCSEHPMSTSSSTCHPTSREALSTGQHKTATRRILIKGCWMGTDIVVVPFVGSAAPHRPWMLLTYWLHILAHQRSECQPTPPTPDCEEACPPSRGSGLAWRRQFRAEEPSAPWAP